MKNIWGKCSIPTKVSQGSGKANRNSTRISEEPVVILVLLNKEKINQTYDKPKAVVIIRGRYLFTPKMNISPLKIIVNNGEELVAEYSNGEIPHTPCCEKFFATARCI